MTSDLTQRTIGSIGTLFLASLLPLSPLSAEANAQDRGAVATRVAVHVVARDAKLIGSAVGGAEVVIRDAANGDVLARGVHEGGTGDTGLIMGDRPRDADVFTTPGAALFTAELALDGPREVRIEASGPLDYPDARTTATTTLLLVPGRHVEEDGVVLELWGYIVDLLEAPETAAAGAELAVRARVRMLCSCPTEPGGLWEAGDVTARLLDADGVPVARTRLAFTGESSEYAGRLAAPEPGDYTIEAIAVSAQTGNAGRTRAPIRVR